MVAPFKPGEANPYPTVPTRQIAGTVATLYDPSSFDPSSADADDHPWQNWCVLAQRIPDGQSGWAYCSGVVMARVRNEEAGSASLEYQYADLVTWEEGGAGSGGTSWYHLNRLPVGPARILWLDSNYGSGGAGAVWQWAMIRFSGAQDAGPPLYKVEDSTDGFRAARVAANGDVSAASEFFVANPEGTLAIPVRTADGKVTLFRSGGSRFAKATSDPSGGTLTVKLANSDGTEVGDDITVYDGGIT
jgi:hypothetical protein